ncbi:SRPBCC family protein [Actinomadura sp. 6N118]|uniref:SRPBCC family protein n=1 Tax=Actinomadura sp. 6N118 TaxID=3375151 RepID=UPI00379DE0A7
MFEFTETIDIAAPSATVWDLLCDVERWWPPSNPEHQSIERLDDRPILEVGARLRIREKVAGIPCVADGEITRVEPLSAVTWEAPRAHYRWFGIPITVGEGVTWSIEPIDGGGTRVSANVWATFPSGVGGHVLEWTFRNLFRGVEKDREHARTELRYLKRVLESQSH